METTEQLFYDDNCPMCKWYSQKFVSANMLSTQGRCEFSQSEELMSSGLIDSDRARNEIPLYFPVTNTTRYGLDALLYLIGKRSKTLEKIGRSNLVYWICSKLYKFISFNRRIIVPKYKHVGSKPDLSEPTHNPFYRWMLVLFSTIVSVAITYGVAGLFTENKWTVFCSIAVGWMVYFGATRLVLSYNTWFNLLSHTCVTMLRGVCIFGFAGLVASFVPETYWPLVGVIVVFSFVDMTRQQFKRVAYLHLSVGYFWFWISALTGGMVGTLLVFNTSAL